MKFTVYGKFKKLKCVKKLIEKSDVNDKVVIDIEDMPGERGISHKDGWITLKYKGKEITIKDMNEGGNAGLFTYDEAMDMCSGFKDRHLPSIEEWSNLIRLRCEWNGYMYASGNSGHNYVWSSDNDYEKIGKEFAEDFKLPLAGYRRDGDATANYQGIEGDYWSSSIKSKDCLNSYCVCLDDDDVDADCEDERGEGRSVRCFKNA